MVALISLLTLSQPFTDFFELSEHPSLLTNSLRPIDQVFFTSGVPLSQVSAFPGPKLPIHLHCSKKNPGPRLGISESLVKHPCKQEIWCSSSRIFVLNPPTRGIKPSWISAETDPKLELDRNSR